MNAPRPALTWPSWVLLAALCLLAISGFLFGNDIASRTRFQVIGRDSSSGDVLLFDGQSRTVRRLRVPTVAEDTLAIGTR
jgi:hypothetical protein